MKINYLLWLCLLSANSALADKPHSSNSSESQRLTHRIQSREITFDWTNAQYQAQKSTDNVWKQLPLLGDINKLTFPVQSPKHQGSFRLPMNQYLALYNKHLKKHLEPQEYKYMFIEPCELNVQYEIDESGLLELRIYDNVTNCEGLFFITLTLKSLKKNEGEASGEIWLPPLYVGNIRCVKFKLIEK